jgi:hypothetical protein
MCDGLADGEVRLRVLVLVDLALEAGERLPSGLVGLATSRTWRGLPVIGSVPP